MIKKIISLLISLSFVILVLPSNLVVAENCAEAEDPDACYLNNYITSSENIKQLKDKIAQAEKDIEKAQTLANDYYYQIQDLEVEIIDLTDRITELEVRIAELEERIAENEAKVEALNTRVLNRMAESQKTMHFNPFLDFILGSSGFADMLRRTYGVEAIMSKESSDRDTLIDTINQLNTDKAEVVASKEELDTKKAELLEKKAAAQVMRDFWMDTLRKTQEMIDEYRNQLSSEELNLRAARDHIGDITNLPTSTNIIKPIKSNVSVSITAGFPYYPKSFGGGIHLGVDFGVPSGTPLYAPANGVILVAYQGCPAVGYLNNKCGGDGNGNGVSYGGNQVYLICSVNGHVYAFTFSHMTKVEAERYSYVQQGDRLGTTGSSGSSTGPHCHIEMFYLGPGDNEDIQNKYLLSDYDLSFNCGWGAKGLQNICSKTGNRAPCRLDAREEWE